MAVTPPPLVADDPRLADRHLLAVADDVVAEEVEVLALSRFAGVRWDTPVPDVAPRGRAARDPMAGLGVLRLSRYSTAVGPFALAPDDARRLGLPPDTATGFLLHCPRERGEPPYPGGDRDGLKRAFPGGMPVRAEERVLRWALDAARRLGGSVRVSGRDGGVVLTPDPGSAVDLTVWSTVWLEPPTALAVVRRAAPAARLAMEPAAWQGPATGTPDERAAVDPGATGPTATGDDPDTNSALPAPLVGRRVRRRLHERADAFDAAALAAPDELSGYGVEVDLGPDGLVVVEAGGDDVPPPVLRDLPWAKAGAALYRVRWEPADVEELEREVASPGHRAARERAAAVVTAIAGALHAVVGGEVADAAEFLVDPGDLAGGPGAA